MVDAEQTWVQPAIDVCVQTAQKLYNKGPVVVYNTMQAYLTDSASRLDLELQRGSVYGYNVGIKLVRGAYMVTETALASKLGYKRPIHDTVQATHDTYNALARKLIDGVRTGTVNAVLATHNEASVQQAVEYMEACGVGKRDGVSFGQLLGMCDHVSFPLGAAGYDSLKVVPYGPIRVVLPYLVRRAQENSDVLGRAGFETRLIKTTLKTRAVKLVKP
jgi:proline dehydrogenase